MKRKFLDDLGVQDRWDQWEYSKEQKKKFKQEQKKYGFDSRECFSMDETFYEWLYERLKMYMKCAEQIIDFESENASRWNYEGSMRSQKWMIERAVENLEYYFTEKGTGATIEVDKKITDHALEAARIFVKILPAMWW